MPNFGKTGIIPQITQLVQDDSVHEHLRVQMWFFKYENTKREYDLSSSTYIRSSINWRCPGYALDQVITEGHELHTYYSKSYPEAGCSKHGQCNTTVKRLAVARADFPRKIVKEKTVKTTKFAKNKLGDKSRQTSIRKKWTTTLSLQDMFRSIIDHRSSIIDHRSSS